ncbi:uncharacterized protein LOC119074055 [Bradysia coprophila]|uniref:uncharacterized protein LOC119074055 n=1 Tax=Bradysia coprophila TaxID=38358 RepID=UPI00187DA0D0|nr:uncharacterized protein LOC119074055 [Bradysia coprophila]
MANKIELIINTLIVVLTIIKTSAAGILAPTALFSNTDQFSNNDNTDQNGYLIRNKRAAYIVPSDYYANYYNDYYNNYYNQPAIGQKFDTPSRPSADRFDGNDDDNIVVSQGTKYVYTPIFKYKSTQQKRRKLFVPNLFG